MSDEPPIPVEPSPTSPATLLAKPTSIRKHLWRRFTKWFWKLFKIESLGADFEAVEINNEKKSKVLVASVVTVLLSIGFGMWFEKRSSTSAIAVYKNQNERQQAQITQDNAEILKLKLDQAKWEKWDKMADAVMTNAPKWERSDLLFKSVESNLLSEITYERPKFDLVLNGVIITNGMNLTLPKSRTMTVAVRNTGLVTATGVTIEMQSEIDKTNFLSQAWTEQLSGKVGIVGNQVFQVMSNFNHWSWSANRSMPGRFLYHADTFTISSNVSPSDILFSFVVYSDKSAPFSFDIMVTIEK